MDSGDDLKPWGDLVAGDPGVSRVRLAEALAVSPELISRLAKPVGRMKMLGRTPFDVYAPSEATRLAHHPDIVRARERRQRRGQAGSEAAKRAAATRRQTVITETLSSIGRPDLRALIQDLVKRAWSPAVGKRWSTIVQVAVKTHDAVRANSGFEEQARKIATNTAWAVCKTRTWKVDPDTGMQDVPLVLTALGHSIDAAPHLWRDVLLASIRHCWFDDVEPKSEGRMRADQKLTEISTWWAERARSLAVEPLVGTGATAGDQGVAQVIVPPTDS